MAFWALVILAGIALLGGNSLRPGSNLLAPRDARSILDDRFANGEPEAEMKKGPVEPGPSSVRGGT
jgi:hypothetical protein